MLDLGGRFLARFVPLSLLTLLLIAQAGASGVYTGFLRASQGGYVYAAQGGGGFIGANSANRSDWERTLIIDLDHSVLTNGDRVRFRAYRGQFWSANAAGGDVVTASSPWGSVWETFRIYKKSGYGEIRSGDPVVLQCADGAHYLTARYNFGDVPLGAVAPWQSVWETFTLEVHKVQYDRYRATNYARNYVSPRNPAYQTFPNDCTNFVSQCLSAGGWTQMRINPLDNDRLDQWGYNPTFPSHPSITWDKADALLAFTLYSGRGKAVGTFGTLQPGDLIFADWEQGDAHLDGTMDHAMVIVAINGNDLTYAQHSDDKFRNLSDLRIGLTGVPYQLHFVHIVE